MYLQRKIDSFLRAWKEDPEHLPLIVKGPRQVGKTESILRFATHSYASVININFALEPQYRVITEDGYSVDLITRAISLIDPSKRFVEGETLVFFDEIQDHPEITTALKSFKIDGHYDVICSGSMLGINYGRIESVSVGYKTDYVLRSMDFEEYLWARERMFAREDILEHMLEGTSFSKLEHQVYQNLFFWSTVLLEACPTSCAGLWKRAHTKQPSRRNDNWWRTIAKTSKSMRWDSTRRESPMFLIACRSSLQRRTRSSKHQKSLVRGDLQNIEAASIG